MVRPISSAELADAVRVLRDGGIVCIPTETTYGLAVAADNAEAVVRVTALKGRAQLAPIATIAGSTEQARALAAVWPAAANTLATRHWPGPLTLVVPARADLPAPLVGALGVGVRVSSHPWPQALARAVDAPITATSANPARAPAATTITQARAYFGSHIACYLDAGVSPGGSASTVVAVSQEGKVSVLRPGPVSVSAD